ncbi:MAG: hypothetical protein WAQ28_18485 [Bacteroidia bacterium]
MKEQRGYKTKGIMAINSDEANPLKCTWNCHNNIMHCLSNHRIKLLKPYLNIISPVYMGIIFLLKATGNYALANIVFLVVLWPLFMYFLLLKSIELRLEIKLLKEKNNGRRF